MSQLDLAQNLRGKLSKNYALAPYTSWHIGGKVESFYQPANLEDLSLFLQQLDAKQNILLLGAGTNILITDQEIDKVVIYIKDCLKEIDNLTDNLIRVEAGTTCTQLVQYCVKNELKGSEFLAGIPGTIGGALAMNAGAFGDEIWNYVSIVETIDRRGNLRTRTPAEFQIDYREVKNLNSEWFVAAHFSFAKGDRETISSRVRELITKRKTSQPLGELTCGSVFRNPQDMFAAKLIEECGLKATQIGDAIVSEKHANFIINRGNATFTDIRNLILHVVEKVKLQKGIELQLEIKIIL